MLKICITGFYKRVYKTCTKETVFCTSLTSDLFVGTSDVSTLMRRNVYRIPGCRPFSERVLLMDT